MELNNQGELGDQAHPFMNMAQAVGREATKRSEAEVQIRQKPGAVWWVFCYAGFDSSPCAICCLL